MDDHGAIVKQRGSHVDEALVMQTSGEKAEGEEKENSEEEKDVVMQ